MTETAILSDQYRQAITRLAEVLDLTPTDIIRDSAIQRFEIALDLGWKTIKSYLEKEKGIICHSPKECFREAYRQGLIDYDEKYLDLVDMRNQTAHLYSQEIAETVFKKLPEALGLLKTISKAL